MTVERGMESTRCMRKAGRAAAPTLWWCGQMARCTVHWAAGRAAVVAG
jgi:hypothetical protein